MTTAIFPSRAHSQLSSTALIVPGKFPDLLADFVCAATDAKDALRLFSSLCRNDTGGSTTPGFMAFDAHVGDTSCQIRAMIFNALYSHVKGHHHLVIGLTIHKLTMLISRAKQLSLQLTIERKNLKTLGLRRSGESRRSMLEALGWFPPHADRTPLYDTLSEKSDWATILDDLINPASTSEQNDGEKWDPENMAQIIRCIVYSYALSKYKIFCRRANIVGAQLDPSLRAKAGQRLMADSCNPCCPGFAIWKGEHRITCDFKSMQAWLGEISCEYVKEMARNDRELDTNMASLLDRTTRLSPKGLPSLPGYITWLVIRRHLANYSIPLLLSVKRFCDHGFHANYYYVRFAEAGSASGPAFTGAASGIQWNLTRVTSEELIASKSTVPHINIYGNSLDGTIEDYMRVTSKPLCRHRDPSCAQNEEHCEEFLKANHDDIALAIMADHRHYAYPIDGSGRNEIDVVAEDMDQTMPGLSAIWRKQKEGAFALGTSASMKIFSWQHIVLETVGRAAAALEASDGLLPLSAPI